MNREALIRKLQQTTAFEMPKQKPNLGTIKNAEFVTEEEVGDLKKILSDIEKLKKIAVKAGREMSDLGDFETRFKGALLDDEAFLKAVKNWKSQRGIK